MKQAADYQAGETQGAVLLTQLTIPTDNTDSYQLCLSDSCSTCATPYALSSSLLTQAQGSTLSQFLAGVGSSAIATYALIRNSNTGTILQCTELRVMMPKAATVSLSWDGVTGSVAMSQDSPYDKTRVYIFFSGMRLVPSKYHIHIYPVSQRLTATEDRCSNNLVAGHFNPYSAVAGASSRSTDQFEIGDLSGKFGTLNNATVSGAYDDSNLPLFGPNSVIGRSIVVHKPDGSRWLCGNIEQHSVEVETAIVRFTTPVYGTMYLRQPKSQPDEDTTVLIELANMNGMATSSHKYHVHVDPVPSLGACSSTAGHYNPATVNIDSAYSTVCDVTSPYRCELGDLSGRHGNLVIASQLRQGGNKYFYSDPSLPLSGAHSVMGRSVVIHAENAGASRYACADIQKLNPMSVSGSSLNCPDAVSTTLSATQTSEFESTQVTYSATATSTSITDSPQSCSTAQASAQYNPFNAATATYTTEDQYGVGDLAGKYGTTSNVALEPDNNLPLFTSLSVAGRGLAMTAAGTSSYGVLTMGTGAAAGNVITAAVQFTNTTTSPFQGTVSMTQIIYEQGFPSLTHLDIDVSKTDISSVSAGHNMHIHVEPVTSSTTCSEATGHFNPYGSPLTACTPQNPLACEVGDLSAKHAAYDINGGRKFYNDEDIPLSGEQTVLGRSIVFHASNGGGSRVVCGNILPTNGNTFTLGFSSTVTYDRASFTTAVASAVNIHASRVTVLHNVAVPTPSANGNCHYVMVHVSGTLDSTALSTLTIGTGLDPYLPTGECASETGALVAGQSVRPNGATTLQRSGFVMMVLAAVLCWLSTNAMV